MMEVKKWLVIMGPHRFSITAKTREDAGRVLDMRCHLMNLDRVQAIFREVEPK